MCIKKITTNELIEENLGSVRFVPLIGVNGWGSDNVLEGQTSTQ